jgi:hypothetical protein
VAVDDSNDREGWIAFSSPYRSFQNLGIQELVAAGDKTVLIAPQIRPYFPCLSQPNISNGVAEVPGVLIVVGAKWPIGLPGSPYLRLPDVAELEVLPSSWKNLEGSPPLDVISVNSASS